MIRLLPLRVKNLSWFSEEWPQSHGLRPGNKKSFIIVAIAVTYFNDLDINTLRDKECIVKEALLMLNLLEEFKGYRVYLKFKNLS